MRSTAGIGVDGIGIGVDIDEEDEDVPSHLAVTVVPLTPFSPSPLPARLDDDHDATSTSKVFVLSPSPHPPSPERGTIVIVGGRMTEKGRGGGDLVETLELHEITSFPYFSAPRSRERAGTYSACILGVWLHCQRHGQLIFRAQWEG